MTDQEILDTWKEIFKLYPQPDKKFIWDMAIAYYNPYNQSGGVVMAEQISYIASYFSDIVPSGYPMSAFMSPEPNGIPYSEQSQDQHDLNDSKNFSGFVDEFTGWVKQQN